MINFILCVYFNTITFFEEKKKTDNVHSLTLFSTFGGNCNTISFSMKQTIKVHIKNNMKNTRH